MKFAQTEISRACAAILAIATTLNACQRGSQSNAADPSSAAATKAYAGTATLSWETPTRNTDGSRITDLAGFYIYYGDTPTALIHTIQVRDPLSRTYVVRNLKPGIHYFSVAAYAASGAQSGLSWPVSKVIP